jgi:hypothetical protein
MARVTVRQTPHTQQKLKAEIAQLSDLGTSELRVRWRMILRRQAPSHLPRHLLIRILAYRLQADVLGDLDGECLRLLERTVLPDAAGQKPIASRPGSARTTVPKGAILSREWNGRMHRVAVLADGFAWNGKTYASLSRIALEITGTRWNGPRFFGLRNKPEILLDAQS